MKVIYRISDRVNPTRNINRPSFFCKRKLLLYFLKIFKGYDIYLVGDNISESTYQYLKTLVSNDKIIRRSDGNGLGFLYCVRFALSKFQQPDTKVYFAEDDYLYREHAPKIISQGLDISDYVSGYDHPDGYISSLNGGTNPNIKNGGELTRVLITENSHWKYTNSCCMTFATTIKKLNEDIEIYQKYSSTPGIPNDFGMWSDLIKNKKRKLVSSLPAVSSHCENEALSPFVNWRKLIAEFDANQKEMDINTPS
jgi:hypothetical protein